MMSLHPDKTKFIQFNYSGQEAEVDLNIIVDNNNENEFLLPQIPLERIKNQAKHLRSNFSVSIMILP
jgi:hypothetical protein